MKLAPGFYKLLPEIVPDLSMPGEYKFTNASDSMRVLQLSASIREEPYYCGLMRAGGSLSVFLEEETYLKLDGEVEISSYVPEKDGL